jgi:hypothetical protein
MTLTQGSLRLAVAGLDGRAFRPVTCFAEQLYVPFGTTATFRDRDDVVKFEIFARTASHTLTIVTAPYK